MLCEPRGILQHFSSSSVNPGRQRSAIADLCERFRRADFEDCNVRMYASHVLGTTLTCLVTVVPVVLFRVPSCSGMVRRQRAEDAKDFDPVIQGQFLKAQKMEWPADIIERSELIDWDALERSQGANREWFWNGALSATAYFSNFLEVEVHPGWVGKVSRMSALIQNPGTNKDAPISVIHSAVKSIQNRNRQLILLDEFSIPFLYQALKHNGCRAFGCYTELDSLLQKASQASPGSVVDPKTRMIRIYDCREWGYGLKGEGGYTFENMEEIPKSLFPVFGAVQPEVYYEHIWDAPLSGLWQRFSNVCTQPVDIEWASSRDTVTPGESCASMFTETFTHIDQAMQQLCARSEHGAPRFRLDDTCYAAFGKLFTRMKTIKTTFAQDYDVSLYTCVYIYRALFRARSSKNAGAVLNDCFFFIEVDAD